MTDNKLSFTFRVKGGPGSGHHGHRGRPGKRGGSLPGGKGGGSGGGPPSPEDDYDVWVGPSGEPIGRKLSDALRSHNERSATRKGYRNIIKGFGGEKVSPDEFGERLEEGDLVVKLWGGRYGGFGYNFGWLESMAELDGDKIQYRLYDPFPTEDGTARDVSEVVSYDESAMGWEWWVIKK